MLCRVDTRRDDNTAPAGFVSLFNGKDLTGWKIPEGDGGHWKVVDGVIDYDAESEAKGDKALWSEVEYRDFVLQIDWRLKEAPFINKNIPYILPDGTHAKDINGKELRLPLPDADSGVYLRGDGRFQANIWCWPIGSGELYSIRTDPKTSPELRAAATPSTQADKPVGQWNHFEITVSGKTVRVALNGKTVISGATIPDLPDRGRIALQHHGGKNKDGDWTGPPSLVQFKNIYIKELDASVSGRLPDAVKGLLITGGHDHEAVVLQRSSMATKTSTGCRSSRAPPRSRPTCAASTTSSSCTISPATWTKRPARTCEISWRAAAGSWCCITPCSTTRAGTGGPTRWSAAAIASVVQATRPRPASRTTSRFPSAPATQHPVTAGIAPFQIKDETYKSMRMSPKIRPLLTTDNPTSDPNLAWIGPDDRYRVVAIQLGHGHTAFGNPSYRALVHNAILWAAGKTK